MHYPIILHHEAGTTWGVTVPDLPGCFSAGGTEEEALRNAEEAIRTHIEVRLDEGMDVPEPSVTYAKLMKGQGRGAILALIKVDPNILLGHRKRINITFPERLLPDVDAFARENGESRSSLFVHAVVNYMKEHALKEV